MRKRTIEHVEDQLRTQNLLRETAQEHALDGTIVNVFDGYVNVRLKGANRKIITNVMIADHIEQHKLYPSLPCKISRHYERGLNRGGRYILVAILPLQSKTISIPPMVSRAPLCTAKVNCADSTWNLSWTQTEAQSYELWWATDEEGNNAEMIIETVETVADVAFDEGTPPRIYFSVKSITNGVESDFALWVTDFAFLTSPPLVTFGDDENHGHVTPNGTRWKVYDGKVMKSIDQGASWQEDTPPDPPNTWSDSPAPTAAVIKYIQVFGDDDYIFVLGSWQNGTTQERGWMYFNDILGGSGWTTLDLRNSSQDEINPIWGDYVAPFVFVTMWQKTGATEILNAQEWDFDNPPTHSNDHSLGASTLAQLASREYYAFPELTVDDSSLWHLVGRFAENPNGAAGPFHIIKTSNFGTSWDTVINSWGTFFCSSLTVRKSGTDIIYWASKQAGL